MDGVTYQKAELDNYYSQPKHPQIVPSKRDYAAVKSEYDAVSKELNQLLPQSGAYAGILPRETVDRIKELSGKKANCKTTGYISQ